MNKEYFRPYKQRGDPDRMHHSLPSQSLTGIWIEETEAGSGGELNGSKAQCARGGLASAGVSPSSGIHLPVCNLAGLGTGASMSRKSHVMGIVYNDTCVCVCVCV